MDEADPKSFKEQLRYWSIHCSFTALSSFFIALKNFNTIWAILAMLCGIATFVVAFTLITSASFYTSFQNGLIGRSIRLGARIRMLISLGFMPFVLSVFSDPPGGLIFVPDFWFGYVAVIILSYGLHLLGTDVDFESYNFLIIYSLTIIEGILISISLIFIAFIALIALNRKRNTRGLPQNQIPS